MRLLYARACCRLHCLHTTEPTLAWQIIHTLGHPFGL